MKIITEYSIVSEYSLEELEDVVTGWIKLKWQPYGGLFVTPDEKDCLYCQAMVIYED